MSLMIDTHCHLADKAFDADREVVLQRAREVGVSHMIVIADSLDEGEKCLVIAAAHDDVSCTIGVHPHRAKDWRTSDDERLRMMLRSSKKVVAVGEIGLDYHYDYSPRDVQQEVFRTQLVIAKELELPAVVHCREAIADVRRIIEDVDAGPFVLHCCTEAWDDVAWIVERGSMLSFTGIATFPKSTVIHETIRNCPLTSLMVETDAPYLAPIPHRGSRCESMHVVDTARFVADLQGLSLAQFDPVVTKTAVAFFGLPS